VRCIFLKGVGPDALWAQGVILTAMGKAILLAVRRFRKSVQAPAAQGDAGAR
jgi:hypothetical protein